APDDRHGHEPRGFPLHLAWGGTDMTDAVALLPSWREGAARDSVVEFLAAAEVLPVEERVACFDNDGTLWCEKPTYVQLDFFVDALQRAAAADPSLRERAEFAAVLSGDRAAMADIGLPRVAMALAELFAGMTPEAFTKTARDFVQGSRHRTLGRAVASLVYQPMLELIFELRRRDFTVALVTGGGTEFVRAISPQLYGVPPELVVGTGIGYELHRDLFGKVALRRLAALDGDANEGAAKVSHIQAHLGRRPILAAGNSGGDREMLEWASSTDGPHLALLVDHDDADREFAYVSSAETFTEPEPITDVARRLGWTVVSMRNDWSAVFPG
ncbi:MAG TPA: HAD family hydrolase, partial [Acidimicrobiales bacterium]